MKIRIKNIIISTIVTIAFFTSFFFLQITYYNISVKYKIKKEIRNEFKRYQQERMKKLREEMKCNQRKC